MRIDDRGPPHDIRRSLTSVFIDLVGSTALSVLLEDHDYNRVLGEYRALVAASVARHGGIVQRDEGDGRYVWFGWPAAHRDDADRALTMALGLTAEIAPLAASVRSLIDRDLALRIGIHSGLHIINVRESDGRPDARGVAVNLAAKVQQHCEPGQVLITEATADVLTTPFDLVPHGLLTIESLEGGIRLYRVAGVGQPSRLDRSLIGRAEELELLQRRWTDVTAGGSATVVLVGAAGLGKSRMLDELQAAGDRRVIALVGDEHRADAPMYAWKRALQPFGLVTPDDVPTSTEMTVAFLRATASEEPLLVIVDDAQWLDASSAALVDALARESMPHLMLVIATRPGATNLAWTALGEVLRLAPLDPASASTLLDDLDGSAVLDDADRQLLIERSGGNPLFLRWLARARPDSAHLGIRRVLRSHSGVPVVIQHVMRSVLDESGVDELTTSTAAAVGQEFDAALLAAVLDRDEVAVEDDLRRLASREIVRRADVGGRRYRFAHALVRDLAYDLLLPAECIRRHARIADTLESFRPSEHALIGMHHDRANRPGPAARAKLRAARDCRSNGAYTEGAGLTSRVRQLLEADPTVVESELRHEVVELDTLFAAATNARTYEVGIGRGSSLTLLDAVGNAERDRWTCVEKTRLWAGACMHGELEQSAGLLHEVHRIARRRFPEIAPYNLCARGYHLTLAGRYRRAEALLRRGTSSMLAAGPDPWMEDHWPVPDDPVALCFAYLPIVLLQRGHLAEGLEWLDRARQRAERLPNGAFTLAHISLNHAQFHAVIGDGPAVEACGQDIAKIGSELDAPMWVSLGGVYEKLGHVMRSPAADTAAALDGVATAYEDYAPPLAAVLHLYAAKGALAVEARSTAVVALDAVFRLNATRRLAQYVAEALRLRATTEPRDTALETLATSLKVADRQGASRYGLRAMTDLVARDHRAVLDDIPVEVALGARLAEFAATDSDPDVAAARVALAATSR